MKKLQRWILVFMLICFGWAWILPPAFGRLPKELTFEPLKFNPPKPEKRTLSNGMTLYLLEDHELPLFNVQALIETGTIYDPPDKVGLASICADVMRTGGTVSREPDALNEELESMAASVEIEMDEEYGIASLSTLADDIDKGLEIFADVLRNPAFRQDKLELRKQQEIEGIRRRNDDPLGVAGRYFSAILYGTNHPFGWYPEIEGIESITADDLRAFHANYYHPNNIMLSITGDFNTEKLIAQLEKVFAGWEKAGVNFPDVPKIDGPVKPSVNYIFKDLNQTTILMGHFGIQRAPDLPDYFSVIVMNEILGESEFTPSRLMREVRDERGLAYSVGSRMDRSLYTNPGRWIAYSQTRTDKTAEATALILDIIKDMRENPVPEAELQLIKDSIINSFVFRFKSSAQIAFQQMVLDYHGQPPDYIDTYTDNIAKVTADDVLRAAKKYLHPEQMVIVAVGNRDRFDRPLTAFGQVTEIDITIPQPSAKPLPQASEADTAKAKQILAGVVTAYGGVEKLKAVKTVSAKGRISVETPMGRMDMTLKQSSLLPNKWRQDINIPQAGMDMSYVFNGQSAWVVTPQGTQPFPESLVEELKKGTARETTQLLVNLSDNPIPVQYLGTEDVNGKLADVIGVNLFEDALKLFIDPETRYIVKKAYRTLADAGPVDEEEFTDDYREVGGVKVGYHVVTHRNGKPYADITFSEVMVNAAVDASVFEK
ncbi:insulinase family protein [Candidatus Poribacteria bacterium]|nr:insulinase family protein [Candidatus Poribacteria bacterium]